MTNTWNKLTFAAVVVLCVLAVGAIARGTLADGGALEPGGPPAPGMKSLQEVEPRTPISSIPYTITQPGSYYLTGNLTAVSDVVGITVNASDVTLDLNGFTVRGIGLATSTTAGVYSSGVTRNLHVSNGTVRDWLVGIDTSQSADGTIQDVAVTQNGCNGLAVGGDYTVTRVRATYNNDVGSNCAGVFFVGGFSTLTDSQINENSGHGVLVFETRSVVRANTIEFNGEASDQDAGVRVEGDKVVVAGNRIVGNTYGVYAPGATGTLILQNQLSNYGGNYVGAGVYMPVQSPPTVTDPWANISY